MSDWTPDTDHVRAVYLHGIAQDEANKGIEVTPAFGREIAAQFDRWLDQVKADAWDEGEAAGWTFCAEAVSEGNPCGRRHHDG